MTRSNQSLSASVLILLVGLTGGCAVETTSVPPRPAPTETRASTNKRLDSNQAMRLRNVMIPLLQASNKSRLLENIRIGVIDDPSINAANAGGGEFYVTTGLLQKATDAQLRGILAHEIAHDDLGHVARALILGVGLNLGVILLEQILPGSSTITPMAGTLVARAYSRSEELEADRHGVEILQRAGYSKDVMIDTLTWIARSSPEDGGGFLSTHPGDIRKNRCSAQVESWFGSEYGFS